MIQNKTLLRALGLSGFVCLLLFFWRSENFFNDALRFIPVCKSPSLLCRATVFEFFTLDEFYRYSPWIFGQKMYSELGSWYPQLTNFFFGLMRFLSSQASRLCPFLSDWGYFKLFWFFLMGTACFFFIQLARSFDKKAYPLWVFFPLFFVFSLMRFDILTTLLCLLGMMELFKGRDFRSALLFSFAIALKGYFLFCVPLLLFYFWKKDGIKKAAQIATLLFSVTLFSMLAVFLIQGESPLTPYFIQSNQGGTGADHKSLYVFLQNLSLVDGPFSPPALWIGFLTPLCLVIGSHLYKKSYLSLKDLGNALFGILVSFMVGIFFFGPQYFMWLFPFFPFIKKQERALLIFHTLFYYALFFFFFSLQGKGIVDSSDDVPFAANMMFGVSGLLWILQTLMHLYFLYKKETPDAE